MSDNIRGSYQKSLPLFYFLAPGNTGTLLFWVDDRWVTTTWWENNQLDRSCFARCMYSLIGTTLSAIVRKLWSTFGHPVSRCRRQQCRRNYRPLLVVYGKDVMPIRTVREWVHRFAALLHSIARNRMTERTSQFLDDSTKGSSILNYTYKAQNTTGRADYFFAK